MYNIGSQIQSSQIKWEHNSSARKSLRMGGVIIAADTSISQTLPTYDTDNLVYVN